MDGFIAVRAELTRKHGVLQPKLTQVEVISTGPLSLDFRGDVLEVTVPRGALRQFLTETVKEDIEAKAGRALPGLTARGFKSEHSNEYGDTCYSVVYKTEDEYIHARLGKPDSYPEAKVMIVDVSDGKSEGDQFPLLFSE